MGTFLFRWPYADAEEVYVTGTFDDWSKSEQLSKKGDGFEKEVKLSDASKKIYYKFFVDGEWKIDAQAPQETDEENHVNNLLKPEDIKKEESAGVAGLVGGAAAATGVGGVAAAVLSNVLPESTTAKLAGDVPKEAQPTKEADQAKGTDQAEETDRAEPTDAAKQTDQATDTKPTEPAATGKDGSNQAGDADDSSPPGAFPETPALENNAFAASSAPQSQPVAKGVDDGAATADPAPSKAAISDEESKTSAGHATAEGEKQFGVAPIAASSDSRNPVSVAAGESVDAHKNTSLDAINATATTSKEDYEKAGTATIPIVGASGGGSSAKPSAFTVPEKTKNMIPESSLPMSGEVADTTDKGPFIQSAGAGTTTAALAGQVPLEQKPVQADGAGDSKPAFIQSAGSGTTTAGLAGGVPLEKTAQAAVADDETPSATVSGPSPDVPEVVQESMAKNNPASHLGATSPDGVEGNKTVGAIGSTGGATGTAADAGTPMASDPTKKLAADLDKAFDNRDMPSDSSKNANTAAAADGQGGATASTPTGALGPARSKLDPGDPLASQPTGAPATGNTEATTAEPTSASGAADKKSKRKSLFGKIREKFKA